MSQAVYHQFYKGLLAVHSELRGALTVIVSLLSQDRPGRDVDIQIQHFSANLQNHHKSEDRFFFPAFRESGRMRSSDLAFLAARDKEHEDILRLCKELETQRLSPKLRAPSDRTRNDALCLATELNALSLPHFAAEELTLIPNELVHFIGAADLTRVYRDMGLHWNQR
jgi:hypothetical protein